MTARERQILALLQDDPMISQQAIAERLGISRSAVAGHIMHLTNKGVIKGRGYVLSTAPFVAVIGGANIDIHGRSAAATRARDSNPGSVITSAGGVARNIAENLARLGIDSRLITAIGKDHHGQTLMRLSREAGIDMQYAETIASAPTSTYLSVVDHSGDMQVAISDMDIIDQLGAERLQRHKDMLLQASLVILDANLPDDALGWLTSTLDGRVLFADTVSTAKAPRIRPYLAAIHTLKASAIEAEALTGLEAGTDVQLRKLCAQLHESGVQRVFITRGNRGVYYSTPDGYGTQKTSSRRPEVRNTGGAGDAFLAGLAFAWLESCSLDESLQFALTAADITLSHPATNSPALSVASIRRALESHGAERFA